MAARTLVVVAVLAGMACGRPSMAPTMLGLGPRLDDCHDWPSTCPGV